MSVTHKDDLFAQSVCLIHIMLTAFQNLLLTFQYFTLWSSHDTLFHFNAGVFVQVHRFCIFNLP